MQAALQLQFITVCSITVCSITVCSITVCSITVCSITVLMHLNAGLLCLSKLDAINMRILISLRHLGVLSLPRHLPFRGAMPDPMPSEPTAPQPKSASPPDKQSLFNLLASFRSQDNADHTKLLTLLKSCRCDDRNLEWASDVLDTLVP
jgi:hypothetical protein